VTEGGGAGWGFELVQDLNNLLLDAETHAAKLENTHLGAVDSMMGSMMLGHGDAGFLLDDAASASSSQPPGDSGGGSGSGVGAEGGSVVEEVFREEVYEQQVCARPSHPPPRCRRSHHLCMHKRQCGSAPPGEGFWVRVMTRTALTNGDMCTR